MQKTIIIILLCLLGIFVHPFDPGLLDFIYRFIIFAIIIYLVYTSLQSFQEEDTKKEDLRDFPAEIPSHEGPAALSEPDPLNLDGRVQVYSILNKEQRTKAYLKDQFDLLASLIFPDYGWIFYKNNEEIHTLHHQALVETELTEIPERLPVNGLIKILDEKNDIVIENNLDTTKNLITYYQHLEYKPGSFLGLPVTLSADEKLFFVFDSHHTSHFNIEESSILSNLIKNTGIWLQTRIRGYEILAELNLQKKLLGFARSLNQCKSINSAMEEFTVIISKEFEATRLTISFIQKNSEQAVIKKVVGQEDEFPVNTEFPLDEGLSGWVISKDKPYLIEDMEKGEYFIPRYNKSEKSNNGLRSFLGMPLTAGDRTVGAITLEHQSPSKYEDTDKLKLHQYASLFSSTFLRSLAR